MSPTPKLALVVEDDPLQREMLSELLRDRDVDVIHCESAEAGELIVELMGAQLCALIADVKLAGKHSGLDLAELARSRLPRLQIIVVSGDDLTHLPPDVYLLRKPWLPGELLRSVFGLETGRSFAQNTP